MTVEQEILSAYDSNLKGVFSIHEISRKIGKAYPYINKKVNVLVEKGILKRRTFGRSHLCYLNLDNKKTIMLLSLNEISKHDKIPEEIVAAIKLIEEKKDRRVECVVYDPTKRELILTTQNTSFKEKLGKGPWCFETLDGLKKRLVENEEFFAKHIVVSGYEQFFTLLKSQEIERRYHPLL